MNNDFISRQAAIDAIEQHKIAVLGEREWDEGIAYGYAMAHRHLVDIVKLLPSAQAEIVRCVECKWWFKDENYDGLYRCANDGLLRKGDHYCADGERKDERVE